MAVKLKVEIVLEIEAEITAESVVKAIVKTICHLRYPIYPMPPCNDIAEVQSILFHSIMLSYQQYNYLICKLLIV